MKKMFIVVAVVAMSFAACGKKKDAAKPTGGSDMGSATAPAGSDAGSAAGSDAAPAPGM
ncbi:MAG: hypothetical protein IPQ07_02690 [Myxococcales bacterium]|nr:hypothetical protein [Myxococcales bacterium]